MGPRSIFDQFLGFLVTSAAADRSWCDLVALFSFYATDAKCGWCCNSNINTCCVVLGLMSPWSAEEGLASFVMDMAYAIVVGLGLGAFAKSAGLWE